MTNLEMLKWGLEHIANNHNFTSVTDNWEEDGSMCILGNNVPTLADVQMLCSDLHIDRNAIDSSEWGIEVTIPYDWYHHHANETYTRGMEFWKRVA